MCVYNWMVAVIFLNVICLVLTVATCMQWTKALVAKCPVLLIVSCYCMRFNFLWVNVCGFNKLAAIHKCFVHKNLDINGYAWNNGQHL